MPATPRLSPRQTLLILHPAFIMSGILQASNGPLMPSLASTFHWNDSRSGILFLLYFLGSSSGAFFCRFQYSRTLAAAFLLMATACFGVAWASPLMLYPLFLLMGISNGTSTASVNLLVGRNYATNCAPTLTLLNFSWSSGALLAPLLAAPLLVGHSYRTVYMLIAALALCMSLLVISLLEDGPEPPARPATATGSAKFTLIALFSAIAFLEVGCENVSVAWMSTYLLRAAHIGIALAAASTSLYWAGFVSARALASFLLWRIPAQRVFKATLSMGFVMALILIFLPSPWTVRPAVFLLGMSLGPIYPLLLSSLFARVPRSEDSRWMLVIGSFGGAVLPWLTGTISAHTNSLHMGLLTVPSALLTMAILFRFLPKKQEA